MRTDAQQPRQHDSGVVLSPTPTSTSFEQAFLDPETKGPTFFYQWLAALEAEIPGFTDSSRMMDSLSTSVQDVRARMDNISGKADVAFDPKKELTMMADGTWADKVADKQQYGISEDDYLVIKNAMTLADRKIIGVRNMPEAVRVELYKDLAALGVVLHRELQIQYPRLGGEFHADLGMIDILEGLAAGNTAAGEAVGWGKDHLGQRERLAVSIRILTTAWAARRYRTQLITDAYNNSPALEKDGSKRDAAIAQTSDGLRIAGPSGLSLTTFQDDTPNTFPSINTLRGLQALHTPLKTKQAELIVTAQPSAAPAESLAGDDPVLQLKRQVDDAIHRQEQHIAALHTEREQLLQRMAQIDEETEAAGAKHVQLTQARLPLVAYEVGVQRAAQVDAERQQLIDSLKLPDDVLPHVKLLGLNPDQFHDPSDYAHFAGAFGALVTIYRRGAENIEEGRIAELKDAASALATCAKTFGPTHDSTVGLRTTLFASLTDAIGKPALERGKKIIDVIAAPARKPDPPSEQALAAARDALQGTQSPQKT